MSELGKQIKEKHLILDCMNVVLGIVVVVFVVLAVLNPTNSVIMIGAIGLVGMLNIVNGVRQQRTNRKSILGKTMITAGIFACLVALCFSILLFGA